MSAITEELWILVTVLVFATSFLSLWKPIIGFAGLMLGLSIVPFIDATNQPLLMIYVVSLTINALLFIVGMREHH